MAENLEGREVETELDIEALPFSELQSLLSRTLEVARSSFKETDDGYVNAEGDAIQIIYSKGNG